MSRTPIAPTVPFVADQWYWRAADQESKAQMLTAEWREKYEGPNVGPLSRYTMAQWRKAFEEVGYFEAHLLVVETSPGRREKREQVRVGIPHPDFLPPLYRASTVTGRSRWSWTDSLKAATAVGKDSRVPVWVTREPPRELFCRISEELQLLPGTYADWANGLSGTEYVINPSASIQAQRLSTR